MQNLILENTHQQCTEPITEISRQNFLIGQIQYNSDLRQPRKKDTWRYICCLSHGHGMSPYLLINFPGESFFNIDVEILVAYGVAPTILLQYRYQKLINHIAVHSKNDSFPLLNGPIIL